MKLYQDKKWLEEQYVGRKKTTYQVADTAGVSQNTICCWIHKHNIPARQPMIRSIDPAWLRDQYIDQLKSTVQIAREIGVSQSAIWRWLDRYKIPIRSQPDGVFLAIKNELSITPRLLERIEGELLGDGCIVHPKDCRSSTYSHHSKYRLYLEWLSDVFAHHGMNQSGTITHSLTQFNQIDGVWAYRSLHYPELTGIRKRWYPHGKKIVPQGLVLTPIRTLHWYIGDGCLTRKPKRKGKTASITLSTCAFDKRSIDVLVQQLSTVGIKASHQKCSNTLGISAYNTEDFLHWIGPCPQEIESVYAYKWDTNRAGTVKEWQEQYKLQHNIA